jgi:hypothetical protein
VGSGRYGLSEAMGLLDDAIREHLELKRQRGADPSEVARDERAALGPLEDEGYSAKDSDFEESDFAERGDELDDYEEQRPAFEEADRAGGGVDRSGGADVPRSSEETMEVDMRTIIDADLGRDDDAELELNGDAMAASAAPRDASPSSVSDGWEVEPSSAPHEAQPRRWWRGARPVRATGPGGDLSVDGSLP